MSTNSLKSKTIKGIAWSLTDKLINQLGFLAVSVYIAAKIGPESFGLIGMLTIFMLLAQSIVSSGFSQALIQKSHDMTESDASTVFYINLFWATAIYILLYVCAPFIANFYNQELLINISRVLFLVIPINAMSVVVRAKLTIKLDFKSQTLTSIIATFSSSILAIYLVNTGFDYWAIVYMLLSKSIIMTTMLWFFCKWLPTSAFSYKSFKTLFKFGSNLMIAGLVATFVNNLYIALIGKYFNATNVGYFTQATNLSNALSTFISSTLQGVTYPVMTSVQKDRQRLIDIYKQLISITMLVSLPMLVGFAAIANIVVTLFLGEKWIAVVPILVALSFARSITPISSINLNILNAIGRSDLYLKIDLSKLPLTLGALFLALPYGMETLAWSMTFTSAVAFFINAYYPYKLFGFGAIQQLKVAVNYIIASMIMFFIIYIINFEPTYLNLIFSIILGIMIYIGCLFLLKDKFFLKILNEIFIKITNKRGLR